MIRFATREDDEAIRALWESSFPDEGGFNAHYFEQIYRPNQTLLLWESDTLCAMTQMLPYQLRVEDEVCEATYIYGACTNPRLRRMGHMARLLAQSFALDRAAGREASILIPQEAWLFEFYEKFGYHELFFTNSDLYCRQGIPNAAVLRCTRADIPQLAALYKKQTSSLRVAVLRDDEQWEQQLTQFDALGEGIFGLFEDDVLRAYACVWSGDPPWAQELFAADDAAKMQICEAVCAALSVNQIRYTGMGTKKSLGVAKFYQKKVPYFGYMNLMFN